MSYSLRWYQQEACSAAWSFLCTSPGNPVIDLPTGSGKSLVIAELCRQAIEQYAGRVIVVAHRKELLEQNAAKIQSLLPVGIPVGLHSAGLRRHATEEPVIVAGIQSVFKKANLFGARHLVLVDEVHLVPYDGEGMYQTFLNDLRAINPRLRMVGLTATPFRTDVGSLCRADGLFQRVCYSAPIRQLIEEGFLCPLTNKPSDTSFKTDGLKIRGGEFVLGEMETLFESGVAPAAREIAEKASDRHSVLIFCSGVAHAEHIAQQIEQVTGDACGIITKDTSSLLRSSYLERFKSRQLRFLCNVDVLTTGFDAPCVDAIAILRATMSPGLFAQICGRGLRTHESKRDCLLLDFGGNLQRHGPIDAIDYGKDRQTKGTGDGPEKTCPACESVVHLSATQCSCGWIFPKAPREPNHDDEADLQSKVLAEPERWTVIEVNVRRHEKKGGMPSLRVDYTCEPEDTRGNLSETVISEWVCLEHDGFARRKACAWWSARSRAAVPDTIDEAVSLWHRGAIATPRAITTIKDGRFYRITEQALDEVPAEWSEEVGSTWEMEAPF